MARGRKWACRQHRPHKEAHVYLLGFFKEGRGEGEKKQSKDGWEWCTFNTQTHTLSGLNITACLFVSKWI